MYEENVMQQNAAGVAPQQPVQQSGEASIEIRSPYAHLEAGIKELFGDSFDLHDPKMQQVLITHLKINRDQNRQLADAFERDPRLAQMLADIVNGKRNAHSAMARYFGRSMMTPDSGTPEYEEMLAADDERRQEAYRMAQERREYEENLEASRPIIESFCNEHGYEPEAFMNAVWERVVFPILSGSYSHDVCTALDHAINYEQDVEDAFAAGDVKGRNTSIHRMREEFGDGMPNGIRSEAPEIAPAPRRRNSLLDSALEA